MIGVSYCAPTCVKMLTRIVSSRKKALSLRLELQ